MNNHRPLRPISEPYAGNGATIARLRPSLHLSPKESSLQHQIRIAESGASYNVTGAVTLTSDEPVKAAARALREAGADEHDIIFVTGPCVTVAPVSIYSILKPREKPRRSDIDRWMMGMARN